MKFTIVTLAFAALAYAQTRADVPACALPCLDSAVQQKTSCATDDYACICKDQSTVKSAATSCVLSKCGTSTALSMIVSSISGNTQTNHQCRRRLTRRQKDL
jgi:hypothetical protein